MKATLCPISCDSDEVGPSNPIGNLDLPSYVKETVWNRAKALTDDKSAVYIHIHRSSKNAAQGL